MMEVEHMTWQLLVNGRNNTLIGRLEKAGTKLRRYNNLHHYMHTQFHVLSLMHKDRLHVSCTHIQILLMKGVPRSTHLFSCLPVQPPLVLVWCLWEETSPYHVMPEEYIICLPCNWLVWCFLKQYQTVSVTMPTPIAVLSLPVYM